MDCMAKLKHWGVVNQMTDEIHSGYLTPEMNKHRLIWNASAKWLFWKNKGSLQLEYNDILNQLVFKRSNITPTLRSETWQDFMHNYVSLTFKYTFDAKGKKLSLIHI